MSAGDQNQNPNGLVIDQLKRVLDAVEKLDTKIETLKDYTYTTFKKEIDEDRKMLETRVHSRVDDLEKKVDRTTQRFSDQDSNFKVQLATLQTKIAIYGTIGGVVISGAVSFIFKMLGS